MKIKKILYVAAFSMTALFTNKALAVDIILQSEDIAELNGAGNIADNEAKNIDNIGDGTWVRFADVDLTGIVSFSANVAQNQTSVKTITMHLDDGEVIDGVRQPGTIIGTIKYSNKNGWQSYEESEIIDFPGEIPGVQDVFFKFTGGSLNTDFFTLYDDVDEIKPPAVGDTFTEGDYDFKVTSLDPLEVEVSGSTLTALTIPATATDTDKSTEYAVTAIGSGAFLENTTIVSVVLPASVKTLYRDAFSGCVNLETINLEHVVVFSGQNTFYNTPKLTTANLASATELVGNFAFHGLGDSSLTSVEIPKAVTLGRALFSTAQFQTINIPVSVDSISTKTFWNCTALTDVQVNWTSSEDIPLLDTTQDVPESTDPGTGTVTPAVTGNAAFLGVDVANVNLLVPAGTESLYAGAEGWKDFNIVVGQLSAADIVNNSLNIQVSAEALTVTSSSTFTNGNLSIYDITGRVLSSTTLNSASASVNISNLASGVYIVKVTEGNAKLVKRFAKQ